HALNVEEMQQAAPTVRAQLARWWEAEDNPEQLATLQEGVKQGIAQAIPGMKAGLEEQMAGMRARGMDETQIAAATSATRQQIEAMENTSIPSAIDNFFFVKFGSIGFMGATSVDADNAAA